jgi:uncharacterized repeat protein (TIGR02543 family)
MRSQAHARIVLSVAVLFLITAAAAYGQTSISPGATAINSTIRCISLDWPCTGDSDHDATCATQYRILGSGTWLNAMPLLRCDNPDHNGFYGSIFNLTAGTTYEVKLTISDPDGGGTNTTTSVATRTEPVMPTGGHTYHVVPGSGGGSGTSSDPFRGVPAAEAVAQAGDIFLLHAGDYGLVILTKTGAANNHIVYKAAGDGNVIIQGMYTRSYIWLDGLYFQLGSLHLQNTDWITYGRSNGLTVAEGTSASYEIVTRCTFRDFFHSVKCRSGANWYFADNDIRGDRDPLTGGLQGEGIELTKGDNNIVCYNKFRRTADPISYPGKNNDMYGNDIQDASDDGIETDGGKSNCRVFENKLVNVCNNVFTFQPMSMGPWYFTRNLIVLTRGKPWKFAAGGSIDDRYMVANNTIIVPTEISQYAQCLWNAFHKNNLYISYSSSADVMRFSWEYSDPGEPGISQYPFWMTEWDYNGWDCGGKTGPVIYWGTTYSSYTTWANTVGVGSHDKELSRTQVFANWTVPSTTYDWTCPEYLLASGTNAAVDAGIALPNITDGYSGTAPDLGWVERDGNVPWYGPRPLGSMYTLTVNTGSGDGTYSQGAVVNIAADTVSGYAFDEWTGNTAYVANVNSSITTVTMPAANVTVTATYTAIPTYTLTVTSGTGDGSYPASQVVNIAANTPPGGYSFDEWTGDVDHAANVNAANTTVTMPSHAVSVTATYAAIPTYTLTVNSGSGDGSYAQGTVVNIAASAPQSGYEFDDWTGDTAYVANVYLSSTTVTMPASNIAVTATYTASSTVIDYSQDEFQYKFTLRGVPAYMYIPAATTSVKAVLLLQENVAEQRISVHPAIRAACDAADVAIIWCSSGFDAQFSTGAHTTLDGIQSDLNTYGATIGYSGLGNRPLITWGHSATCGYAQRSADAAPEHVLAVIATHGWCALGNLVNYDGPILSIYGCNWEMNQQTDADITLNRGIPIISDAYNQMDLYWMPITVVDQYGSGHHDYDDELVGFMAMYIQKAVAARLDGSGNLQDVDPNLGWLAPGMPSTPTSPITIIPYSQGTAAQKARSIWFFDEELAEAAQDLIAGSGPWNRTFQMVWFNTSGGTPVAFGSLGFPNPVPFNITAGTNQFNIWPTLLNAVPTGFVQAGMALNHSSDPTLYVDSTCGAYVYKDGSGVRRVKMNRGSTSGYLFARHTGDSTYRRAVQPANFYMGGGGAVSIDNPGDQVCGASVGLDNNSTSSVYYGYYVKHGPARITGSGYTLDILPIPANTTGSLPVELHAYTLGTTGCTGDSYVTFNVSRGGSTYTLTVNSGTGDGTYVASQVVNIAADAPQSGYAFDEWTGSVAYVANVNSANTTVTMPASNITVTATYQAIPTYTLTVTSGTGDGAYAQSAVVNISADAPQAGDMFDQWTGSTQYIDDVYSANTTVTMPASNITVTATYTSEVTYALTVTSGTGDGDYIAGTVVDIVADAPAGGYAFSKWSGDTAYVASIYDSSTTLTMPALAQTVTASYIASSGDTFIESNGQVVMEVEHYSDKASGTGTYSGQDWTLNTGISGDSGDCMQVLPNSGYNAGDTSTEGPVMNFKINFSTTGVYYFLMRMPAQLSGADDSCNVGMDGAIFQGQVANSTGAWAWKKAANTKTVSSTGLHTINVWMREDGCITDKIVFTTNAAYAPAGTDLGPAESPLGGGATYTLTVTSGSGSGSYEEDDVVNISADAAPAHYHFVAWTGDVAYVANVNASSTTVTMPAANVTVAATFAMDPVYTLTVNSGSGDGSYYVNDVVNINAVAPPAHYQFNGWTGDTAYVANVNLSSTTVTMPAANVTVTATYTEDPKYTLTVTSGTGDGSYYEDDVVNIVADAPQTGYLFDEWTGSVAYVANVNSASTTVTMPAQNISVTATYQAVASYALTVNSGAGDGSYPQGQVVNIAADAPQAGKAFSQWTGDTDHVANVNASSTTVTMPAHAVTVTATYVDVNYTLTVNSGTGDGSYPHGQVVNISADAPQSGYAFSQWTGNVAYVGNIYLSSTTVTMPAQNVSVTATYAPVGGGDTFQESSGMVVMEAEHYSEKASGIGSYSVYNWELNTTTSGDSGDSMQVLPNSGINVSGSTDGPVMDYKINFSTTGVYYALVRMPALSGTDDSVNLGMDDTLFQIQLANPTGAWAWRKAVTSTTVSSPGLHTFNIWMREDGVIADKIILTTNAAYTLVGTDTGPAESERDGVAPTYVLTVNSGSGDGEYEEDADIEIIADFPPSNYHFVAWTGNTAYVANVNSNITTVTMPAQAVTVTATYAEDPKYTLTVTSGTGDGSYYVGQVANILADAPQSGYVFSAWTGDVAYVANVNSPSTTVTMPAQAVSITATYAATGGDTFQEASGQVVMEVEHYSSLASGTSPYDGASWQLKTDVSGDSGDCMQALPNSGLSTGDGSTAGPSMNYKINFSTTGVYYFYLRMPAQLSGADDSCNVGMDGTIFQSQVANSTGAWSWRKAATTKTVSSTGLHTMNVWMREDGCITDKIVFTTNGSYAPSGADTGPAESSLGGGTPTYSLTVNSGSGDGSYEEDHVVGITADAPATHYHFVAWTGATAYVANVNASSTTVTMPAQNISVTATYAQDTQYTLTVNSGTGDGSYFEDEAVGITADAPPANYHFVAWTGSTAYVANVNSSSTTVTMPAQNISVTATYVANTQYTLTVNSGTGDGSYYAAQVVNIAADTPPSSYYFDRWTGDTSGVASIFASSTTITMPAANATVTATYAPLLYTLTVNNGTGDGSYAPSTVVDITADAPASGYEFSQWTGDIATVANVNSSSTTITMPSANAVVTATYVPILYTLTVNSGNGDGDYEANDVVDITAAAPQNGYVFDEWIGDVAYVANVDASSTTVTMPAQSITVTATYVLIPTYTLTVNAGSGDGDYPEDEEVEIVANAPETHYYFVAWTGATAYVANVNSSTTIVTMPAQDITVTATYAEDPQYYLTVNSGTGDGEYYEDDVVNITADAPPQDYVFDAWTGDTAYVANVSTSSTTVTMPAGNVTVTATYTPVGAGDTFQESGGQVVMEVEHYSAKRAGINSYTNYNWTLNTTTSGDSGDCMQVLPNNGTNSTGTDGPRMDFYINFSTTGVYYAYTRVPGLPSIDNKISYGKDETFVNYYTQADTSNWIWKKSNAMTISSTGVHNFNLWQKLDGAICDKIVMTTNSSYAPAGTDTGPSESSRQ